MQLATFSDGTSVPEGGLAGGRPHGRAQVHGVGSCVQLDVVP